jgi:hypothetical protein
VTRLLKSAPSKERSGWASMDPEQPRTCAGCGEKLVMSGPEPLWFSTSQRLSWHAACRIVSRKGVA